jgi:transposase
LKKYLVKLTAEERAELEVLARKRTASVRQVKRALILLAADEAKKDEVIARQVQVSAGTVARVRQRFAEEGLKAALSERARPGKARLLDGRQEAHLIALTCSPAPAGHAKWTLRLLADRMVQLDVIEDISHQTVWRALKRGTSSPGSGNSGASPQ